jgi:hypothetical protein
MARIKLASRCIIYTLRSLAFEAANDRKNIHKIQTGRAKKHPQHRHSMPSVPHRQPRQTLAAPPRRFKKSKAGAALKTSPKQGT